MRSQMKIHLICDPGWSTGVMAKDLIALMPDKNMVIHPWGNYALFPEDDLLICFSATTLARWPVSRRRNAIHLCVHPHEVLIPEFQDPECQQTPLFLAGMSRECRDAMQSAFPKNYAHFLPVTARAGRFQRRKRPGIKVAGFIGRPQAQNMQITGPAKRPEWFREICNLHGLTPQFSHADYSYENMQEFYDSIDVLFCTSSSEGGPLGPFEAALCGVPVISTKVGLWGECNMNGYFSTITDPAIRESLEYADQLADEQFNRMQSVTMEAVAPIWRSAIDLLVSQI